MSAKRSWGLVGLFRILLEEELCDREETVTLCVEGDTVMLAHRLLKQDEFLVYELLEECIDSDVADVHIDTQTAESAKYLQNFHFLLGDGVKIYCGNRFLGPFPSEETKHVNLRDQGALTFDTVSFL